MTARATRRARGWVVLPLVLATLAAMLVAACTPGTPAAEPDAEPPESPEPTIQAEDLVNLTIYYRDGNGEDAHLVGVRREVPVDADLPLRALEMLIDGPGPEDGDLEPPLPPTTEVRDLHVEDATAHVDLSAEVITDAEDVGANPANEALALAAIADTLTEFPEIDRVRMSVEGRSSGVIEGIGDVDAFWGGWGLPEVLVRDDSVIEPEGDRDLLPDLEAFAAGSQSVGSAEANPVDVLRVRARDRTSYLRVVIELADALDEGATAAVPPARAWATDEAIVLELRDVIEYDADTTRLDPDDPTFEDIDAELDGHRLRVTVSPAGERTFALHTLTSPVRVVLDIRK